MVRPKRLVHSAYGSLGILQLSLDDQPREECQIPTSFIQRQSLKHPGALQCLTISANPLDKGPPFYLHHSGPTLVF